MRLKSFVPSENLLLFSVRLTYKYISLFETDVFVPVAYFTKTPLGDDALAIYLAGGRWHERSSHA